MILSRTKDNKPAVAEKKLVVSNFHWVGTILSVLIVHSNSLPTIHFPCHFRRMQWRTKWLSQLFNLLIKLVWRSSAKGCRTSKNSSVRQEIYTEPSLTKMWVIALCQVVMLLLFFIKAAFERCNAYTCIMAVWSRCRWWELTHDQMYKWLWKKVEDLPFLVAISLANTQIL